jgi:hypothetical protein
MSADAPTTVPAIRRATTCDLPRLGSLGALLVEAHHDLDPQRFLARTHRTAADYASFLSTKLEDPDAAILVAEAHMNVIGYAYAAVQGYDYLSPRGPAGVLHDLIVDPAQSPAHSSPRPCSHGSGLGITPTVEAASAR